MTFEQVTLGFQNWAEFFLIRTTPNYISGLGTSLFIRFAKGVSWEIHNATIAATNKSLSFLEHLISKFYAGNLAKQDELRTVKRAIEGFVERMRRAKELEEAS